MGRAEDILKGLASLREENMLCDIQLEAEGRHVSAHKAVLASASPYFRAMFCGNFKETTDEVVSMKEMSFIGLKNVVECIYATDVIATIDVENIEHVLPTADMLQMNDIIQELVEWMSENIEAKNCLQFLEMAGTVSIEHLEEEISAFILKNFVEVSELTDFENISKATLVGFLAADILKTNIDEFVVYKAARKWILANEVTDDDVVEIMSQVRFGLINPDQLREEILNEPFIQMNRSCHDLIEDAMLYHANVFSQPFYQGTLNKPRGEAGLLMIPCGDTAEGFNMREDYVNVECVSFPEVKHSYVSSRRDIPIVFESMTCIAMNNFLYLFGVYCHSYQTFTKRYHASTDTWLDLAPVPREALVDRAIAHSGNNIFLLGGLSVDSETAFGTDPDNIVNHMDIYDISQNTWTPSIIPAKLAYASAAELRGNIYLTGGDDGHDEDSTGGVWAYDVNGKKWQSKAPMNQGRYFHVLEAVGDNLYAIGGRRFDDNDPDAFTIEMYDPVANQWTFLLPHIYTNFGNSSFVVGTKIYLIGGNFLRDEVHEFDAETKELSDIGELPSDNTSTRNVSAFMILPKLL